MSTIPTYQSGRPGVGSALRTGGPTLIQGFLLILVLAATLFPFYWMVSTSLKESVDILASPPRWFFTPTTAHYSEAFQTFSIGSGLLNSTIVAVLTTAIAIVLGVPAAYAIARFEFKIKTELWFWFITNRMISPIILAVPFFLIARSLNLIDTYWVLVFIYLTFNLPLVVWICSDQMRNIPRELDEAAVIDGAGWFTILTRVALPMAGPGVAVSAIFCFIFSWNELLYSLVLTRSATRTAPVMATTFMSGYELPWGEIMATGTLIVVPVIFFSILVSKHIVGGLTMGALR